MMRAARELLLRPVVAAAVVALVIVLPILAVGEASDNEARAQARAQMFAGGASVAGEEVRRIERYFDLLRRDLVATAAGDVRGAVASRNVDGLIAAMDRAAGAAARTSGGGLGGSSTAVQRNSIDATRVAITDATGVLLLQEDPSASLACKGRQASARGECAREIVEAAQQYRGQTDPRAVELLAAWDSTSRSWLSDPFLSTVQGRAAATVSVAVLITPNDDTLTPIGTLVLDVLIADALAGDIRGLIGRAEDLYVIDRAGRYVVGGREQNVAPLTDLMGSPLVARAIHAQPILTSVRGPVTLREYVADPFSGSTRPFATAVMTDLGQGTRGLGGSSYGWQVLVVPDQTPIRTVDATLTQLRLARLGLGVVLVLGTFLLASALRALTRQRSALVRANAENLRLFNETKEALERQTATGEILQIMARSPSDVQPVLDALASYAAELCNAPAAFVYQIEGSERLIAFYGDESFRDVERAREGLAIRSGRARIQRRILADRRTVHVPDTSVDPEFAEEDKHGAVGFHAFLGAPMMRDAQVIGTIQLCRLDPVPFSDKQIALLETFAAQAAIALENVRLFGEIQEKSRQLEAASRHKSEFLANMSHELRTPLNAVIGFSDVLEQKLFGDLNERQSEYVRDISSSGKHLLDLVNEILDLSKIEAGRMELEPSEFALGDTINGTLGFIRERAAQHRIELAANVPTDLGTVVADERKVRQVLLNLLSNAVKFTPDGGWIGVTARRADGEVTVSVRDSGIGIAPEDRDKVFEEFRQVGKATDRSREGTGLGLTLAKRFIELHGGRIWLQSEVGKGTTFTFALPVAMPAAARV